MIPEDEIIIKNFLDMCRSLKIVNSNSLRRTAFDKFKKRFE